jgi:tetratricopeptide (TPR) repeat protein
MGIVTDLGPMDLAVEGTAAAMARLIAPDDTTAQEDIATQSLLALRRAAANPLDMRRLMMTARLAEVQALLLMLRTYRAVPDARAGEDGDAAELDWLRAAERSLEAMVQGDIFLATNPVGLSSSWLDLGDGRNPSDVPPRDIADYRRRAELVAIADLELVLAPEPIPQRLLHHLTCPECAPDGGWFAAFGVFLGWQLRKRPHLLEPVMGIDLGRPSRQAKQRLEAAFQMARQFASGMERRLALTDAPGDAMAAAPVSVHPPCAARSVAGSNDAMISALSVAFDAPPAALAAIVDRLQGSKIPPVRLGRAVRQHVMILAAVHGRWRRPEWSAFTPAHNALCAGRLDEAAHWGRNHIADTAGGLSERGDLEVLGGRYLEASDLYGRALEATEATDLRGQLSLQLRVAEAMTFQYLTTGDEKAKPIAAETAEAVWQNVQASDFAWAKLRAAQTLAELTVAPTGANRAPSRKSAIAILDSAVAGLAPGVVSLERVEAEALRIELMVELGSIDVAAERPRHYEAAENAARTLASLDLSPLPGWVRERASAAVARGLLRPMWSNASDVTLQQAQDAFEVAISGEFAAMDPHLASLLQWRLGEAHIQLAKGPAAKSRNEVGTIWLARAFRDTTVSNIDRIEILQRMRHALVQLAKGRFEEWRLCQALAVLNKAEEICPKDAPNWHFGGILLQRALIWVRLRALSKDLDELKSAVADADAAEAIFRHLKSPGNVFTALRTKANALLDAGREERDADLVGQAVAVYATIIAEHKALKIHHRDLCQIHMSHGDAADLRGVLLVEPASRTAGREAARKAYREALKLAVAHNLPAKGNCEATLKKLDAA